jgi:hypothetical protein
VRTGDTGTAENGGFLSTLTLPPEEDWGGGECTRFCVARGPAVRAWLWCERELVPGGQGP